MKVRVFIEAEIGDEHLTQFGDKLPEVLRTRQLEAGFAGQLENFVRQTMPVVTRVRAAFIPDLLEDAPRVVPPTGGLVIP